MTEASGGCCGPLGSRIDAINQTVARLSEGHIIIAETYEAIAADPTWPEDDRASLMDVAKFHREVAAACKHNTPIFEEPK